jgi:hypothetical protein
MSDDWSDFKWLQDLIVTEREDFDPPIPAKRLPEGFYTISKETHRISWPAPKYPDKPFDPFHDYCICGHPLEKHTHSPAGKHRGKCKGTPVEDCYCPNYHKKEKG